MDNYVIRERENQLKEFIIQFYQEVQKSSETGDRDLVVIQLGSQQGVPQVKKT